MTSGKSVDLQYKVLVLGNTGVGKSSIIYAFSENGFHANFVSTIGIDFKVKTIEVNGKSVKLQIWASAGEQRLYSVKSAKELYKGAKGIIIVYDITDVRSFGYISKWFESIEEFGESDVKLMLLGNKCDLDELRVVPREFGETLAKERGLKFMETSALHKLNIDKAFHELTISIQTNISQVQVTNMNVSESELPSASSSSTSFYCPCT